MEINYSERRSSLSAKALEDSAIIVSSATVKSRISDTDYAYRQDSNFYYLSGYEEPDSLLLIRPSADKDKYIIFCISSKLHIKSIATCNYLNLTHSIY